MPPVEAFKPLGWISITVTWLAVSFLIYKFRGHKSMSISRHAAAHKQSFVMMGIIESIVLPLFFLFVLKWFTPTFHLPALFTICVAFAAVGLLIAAWVPDVGGKKGFIHELMAYGAALLFIPAAAVLCVSPNISTVARIVVAISLAYEITSWSLFVASQKARARYLYLQIGYSILFHGSVLIAAYVR